MKSKYPNMFSPITIGGVTFKNRVWSAPAGVPLLYDTSEWPNDHVIAYYANKAKGGCANVTISANNMDMFRPYDNAHSHDNLLNPEGHRFWNQLTDAIHFYGAKASIELLGFNYHGYNYKGELVSYSVNGDQGELLTGDAMRQIAELYADVAENAVKCGFDMIFIHGGHGLIISQILSPLYNTRTDEFGGSLENRAKFPIMILDAIRKRIGRKLLIEYRISGSELIEGGFSTDDCIAYLKMIQDKIDIAHISAGSFFSDTEHIMHPNNFLPTGVNTWLAETIKKSGEIHIPVLTLGGYQEPADIEKALAEGKADLVAMARGTIADCDLVNKARTDKEDEIIPCIRCFHCLDYRRAGTFGCSVNPRVGREQRLAFLIPPVGEKKRVVIVGGGPAGMQAAVTAVGRGHEVILLEREDRLGGKLNFSRQVPFKKDLCKFMDYLIRMTEKSGCEIRLNTEATPELVASLSPDVVLAAVGARAAVPPIPGVDKSIVITAEEAYRRARTGEPLGNRIAVLGGGDVGSETACYLAQTCGKTVSIFEMTGSLAAASCEIPRIALTKELEKSAEIHLNATCTAIEDNGMRYTDADGEHFAEADLIVLSAGMVPLNAEAESYRCLAEEFFAIGDCVKAANVRRAVRTGYDSAVQL